MYDIYCLFVLLIIYIYVFAFCWKFYYGLGAKVLLGVFMRPLLMICCIVFFAPNIAHRMPMFQQQKMHWQVTERILNILSKTLIGALVPSPCRFILASGLTVDGGCCNFGGV